MKKVYFTREWPGEAAKSLSDDGYEVEVWPEFEAPSEEKLKEVISGDYFAIVTTVEDPVTAEALRGKGANLSVIAQAGVGVDNIDTTTAAANGITVTNTPGVLDDATADLAFALLCAVARRIPAGFQYVKDDKWSGWHPSLFLGADLKGATVGVVGFGRIGQAFAKRCTGFNMNVIYTARNQRPGAAAFFGARYAELDDLLEQSDIVSLHVPLTVATEKMIDEDALAKMKSSAILINTARGGVVDTDALVQALKDGEIFGAGLDVTEPEPLSADHPLLELDNVVVTPHIGSAAESTRKKMAEMAADSIRAVDNGEEPEHVVIKPGG